MKKLGLLLLSASMAFAQNPSGPCYTAAPFCSDSQTISTSGSSITIPGNGGLIGSFEEIFTGSPATVSVVVQGCAIGGTCTTLDTNTGTSNAIRTVNPTVVYAYYKVTASWTGGTSPTVQINTRLSTAKSSAGPGTFTQLTGDAQSQSNGGATTIGGLNNVNLAGLGTGILKFAAGVPSLATPNVDYVKNTVPNPNTVSDNTGASVQLAWLSVASSGQTPGNYQAYDPTGGCIVSYVVGAGGSVTAVRVVAKGSGYLIGPTFSTSAAGGTAGTISTSLSSPFIGLAHWGDSLTDGGGGYGNTPIPQLTQTFTGIVSENAGHWGQYATQIAVSTGALTTTMTPSGGTIAACASLPCGTATTVTFTTNYEPVNSFGPIAGVNGTCAGIHGFVVYSSGPTYKFTPTQVISSTSVSSCSFQADVLDYGFVPIIWAGRNDVTNSLSIPNAEAAIAAMAVNKPANVPALVLGVLTQTTETSGSTNWNTIATMNSTLASTYVNCATALTVGCGFLSPQAILIAAANPSNVADTYDANTLKVHPLSFGLPYMLGTLASGINSSVTTFTATVQVNGTSYAYSGATSGYVVIDTGASQEEVLCTTISGTAPNLTFNGCTRNQNGSGAFSHLSGVTVNLVDTLHLGSAAQAIIATQIAQWASVNMNSIQNTGSGSQNVTAPAAKSIYATQIIGLPPLICASASTTNICPAQGPVQKLFLSTVTNLFAWSISELSVNIFEIPTFGQGGRFYLGGVLNYVNGGALAMGMPISAQSFGGTTMGTASDPFSEVDVAFNGNGLRFPNNVGGCCGYSYLRPFFVSGTAAAGDIAQLNGNSGYLGKGIALPASTATCTATVNNVTCGAFSGHTLRNQIMKVTLTGNSSASTGVIATFAFSQTLPAPVSGTAVTECWPTEISGTQHGIDVVSLTTSGFNLTAAVSMANVTTTVYVNCE